MTINGVRLFTIFMTIEDEFDFFFFIIVIFYIYFLRNKYMYYWDCLYFFLILIDENKLEKLFIILYIRIVYFFDYVIYKNNYS